MVHVWIFGEYLVQIHDAFEMYRSAELGRTQLLVLQAVQTTAMTTHKPRVNLASVFVRASEQRAYTPVTIAANYHAQGVFASTTMIITK